MNKKAIILIFTLILLAFSFNVKADFTPVYNNATIDCTDIRYFFCDDMNSGVDNSKWVTTGNTILNNSRWHLKDNGDKLQVNLTNYKTIMNSTNLWCVEYKLMETNSGGEDFYLVFNWSYVDANSVQLGPWAGKWNLGYSDFTGPVVNKANYNFTFQVCINTSSASNYSIFNDTAINNKFEFNNTPAAVWGNLYANGGLFWGKYAVSTEYYIDYVIVWKGNQSSAPYKLGPPSGNDTINLSTNVYPETNTNFTSRSFINFNVTGTFTLSSNCSLYINSTYNQSANYTGINTSVSFNVSFPDLRRTYTYYIKCFDINTNESTSVNAIFLDSIVQVNSLYPVNNSNFTTSIININATRNLSRSIAKCHLFSDGVLNQSSGTLANGSAMVSFNMTYGTGGYHNYTIKCNDTFNEINTTTNWLYTDFINPGLTTDFINNSFFYKKNITSWFNISDEVAVHSLNITIDFTDIIFNATLTGFTYNYSMNYNVSGLSPGLHYLNVLFADGHTANSIIGDSWEIDKGLIFHNSLTYSFKKPYNTGFVTIKEIDESLFDYWDTAKLSDRYTFEYTPSNVKDTYIFRVEAKDDIDIITADKTIYKKWLVFDRHWLDFYPYDIKDIKRISKNIVEVSIAKPKEGLFKFNSIGDLNIINTTYTFYVNHANVSYSATVPQLAPQTISINITKYGVNYTNASLVWNNTAQTVIKLNYSDFDYYYSTFITSGFTSSVNVTFDWIFNFTGNFANESDNLSYTQEITTTALDNCSVFNTIGFIFNNYNQTDNALFNVTSNAYLGIYSQNSSLTTYFNLTWGLNSSQYTCFVPNGLAFNFTGQIEFIAGSVTKTYYLVNATISNASQIVNMYWGDGSTLVAFTVSDENDNPVTGAYITVLKYDFGTNTYKMSEILKTDSQGKAIGNIVLNTVWYKFIITYNNHIYLETEPTKLITNTYTFQIILGSDYFENYNIIDGTSCALTFDNATKCFSYTFLNPTGEVLTGCLNLVNKAISGDNIVNSSCVNAATSTINLCVAENTTSKSYIGQGTLSFNNDFFICEEYGFTDEYTFKQWGTEAILLTFLLVITLIFIGIWNPVIAIVLCVIAIFGAFLLKIFFLGIPALLTLIILGGIALYRVNRK